MMSNPTEKEEKKYLARIIAILEEALTRIDANLTKYSKELKENKTYLYENKAGMDHAEKVSVRQSILQHAIVGETAVSKKKRLRKLLDSPYFGRMDFREQGAGKHSSFYIGIYSYFDEKLKTNFIHDWRAPVSGMYYDFEPGKAWYEAPTVKISGELLLKRQYRIRNGDMEYMLENSINVHDDILQKELSKSSDEKMKNIVATIQRDQNAIIRNETSRTLIIQGVAGSGKTSIALHRIAFLLYRFKEDLSSKDILIVSPNKVFADYISNVLPELGEDKIPEQGMEELASEILENKVKFQTFFEQVALLLEKNDESYKERIKFKSSAEFMLKLDQFIAYMENEFFSPADLVLKKRIVVPQWFFKEKFENFHRLPLLKRLPEIARETEENINFYYNYELSADERNEIRKTINDMFRITNLRELYKAFYDWLNIPHLLKPVSHSRLEYADVFPLIYLKIRLEGSKNYDRVKHLLVDEMQDYTPIQYAVLSRLFSCKKTILGDAGQSVNPFSSSKADAIQKVFPDADIVKLQKSYRSTFQITRFAQQIKADPDLVAIERHGHEPIVLQCSNLKQELDEIRAIISDFSASGQQSLGIICKTQKQAMLLAEHLEVNPGNVFLLNTDSSAFARGVVITNTHMAKGLEFDWVIVPHATQVNYKNNMDKSLLYIACTRAMHRLFLVHTGKATDFIMPTHS